MAIAIDLTDEPIAVVYRPLPHNAECRIRTCWITSVDAHGGALGFTLENGCRREFFMTAGAYRECLPTWEEAKLKLEEYFASAISEHLKIIRKFQLELDSVVKLTSPPPAGN